MQDFDSTDIGVNAAELMGDLAAKYADADEVQLGVVAVVAEVNYRDGDSWFTEISYQCNDPRRWVQRGLLEEARDATRRSVSCDSCEDEE